MPLADIETPPQTDADKAAFDFAHQDIHRKLITYLQPISDAQLDAWVLDPLDVASETTVYQHQAMHDQLDALLGTPNYNMTTLNWKDQGSRAAWVNDNYQAHLNYSQIVGFD